MSGNGGFRRVGLREAAMMGGRFRRIRVINGEMERKDKVGYRKGKIENGVDIILAIYFIALLFVTLFF